MSDITSTKRSKVTFTTDKTPWHHMHSSVRHWWQTSPLGYSCPKHLTLDLILNEEDTNSNTLTAYKRTDQYSSEAPENWCFQTAVLEKTLESPLESKEIKPVHPKGNESWIFIGRTNAEAETPTPWLPDAKCQPIGKDPDAGKDWGWEEKGTTEDEMVGWHHWLKGHEFEQTPEDNEGQGSLASCSPWGHKESDTTYPLNNTTTTTLQKYQSQRI